MKIRTLFISDTHLGSRHSQPKKLLEFLNSIDCQTIYLVGDFIEGWTFRKFKKEEGQVIQKVLSFPQIYYIVGNHDEFFRNYLGTYTLNGSIISIKNEKVFTTFNGDKYLVVHGDNYDVVNQKAKWLSVLGDYLYHWMIDLNRLINLVFPKWTFSKFLKYHTKKYVKLLSRFAEHMTEDAKKKDCSGVICGHIHTPEITKGEFTYINTGDWIESNSAIYEDMDGNLHLWENNHAVDL